MAKILDNIQSSIFQVKSLIQGNSEIRKLVYYDTKDALSKEEVSFEDVAEHFTLSAIFDSTEPPFDKNTIISIVLVRGNADEEKVAIYGTLRINVLTKSKLWEINNQKIRPLEISNLIIETLNNQKIANSNKLIFSNISVTILDEKTNGYSVSFLIEDGSGFNGEF